MDRETIYETLKALPHFVDPTKFDFLDKVFNEDVLRLYDISSYKWINIFDDLITYDLQAEMVFFIENEELISYIEKQKNKGEDLRIHLVEEKGLTGKRMLEKLKNIAHLNQGVIAQNENLFPEEWTYFFNTNNGDILSFNHTEEKISITDGDVIVYFEERENVIKFIKAEEAIDRMYKKNIVPETNSLSSSPKDNDIENDEDETKIPTQLSLKKLL